MNVNKSISRISKNFADAFKNEPGMVQAGTPLKIQNEQTVLKVQKTSIVKHFNISLSYKAEQYPKTANTAVRTSF